MTMPRSTNTIIMKRKNQGFTLIELMIVVAGGGVFLPAAGAQGGDPV